MQVIVLGSTSKYRAELLSRLHLPFTVASPVCDEVVMAGEAPDSLARRLAQTKALSVQQALQNAAQGTSQNTSQNTSKNTSKNMAQDTAQSPDSEKLIIGSDQVASLGDTVLGKPGSARIARQQLQTMRGQSVVFFTALTVLNTASGQCVNELDRTVATMRDLSDDEIDRYIAADNPLDCAGSFKVEQLGISLFDRVESSDPTALVGLPLIKLCQCLREFGVAVP